MSTYNKFLYIYCIRKFYMSSFSLDKLIPPLFFRCFAVTAFAFYLSIIFCFFQISFLAISNLRLVAFIKNGLSL